MTKNFPQRRSIRLKDYDYSQAGVYFVTLCAQERKCFFGEVVEGEMRGNEWAKIISSEWEKSADIRSEVELGPYIIMPNHFHGIIFIKDRRGDRAVARSDLATKSIGAMVAGFKAAATARINILRQAPGAPVWQRNYYDHVTRDEDDYNRIVEYITTNPQKWPEDSLNPNKFSHEK